jgi:hypothetical protein
MPLAQVFGKPARRFRDDLQCANYCVNRLSFGANARKSSPAVKAGIASTVSMMSDRRCVGFLEGHESTIRFSNITEATGDSDLIASNLNSMLMPISPAQFFSRLDPRCENSWWCSYGRTLTTVPAYIHPWRGRSARSPQTPAAESPAESRHNETTSAPPLPAPAPVPDRRPFRAR